MFIVDWVASCPVSLLPSQFCFVLEGGGEEGGGGLVAIHVLFVINFTSLTPFVVPFSLSALFLRQVPATPTAGRQQPINKLSDLMRESLAHAGFTEVLTWALCSHDENYGFLRKPDDQQAVKLSNPQTLEFQLVRTTLLGGLLKTLAHNQGHLNLPIKLFEGNCASASTFFFLCVCVYVYVCYVCAYVHAFVCVCMMCTIRYRA